VDTYYNTELNTTENSKLGKVTCGNFRLLKRVLANIKGKHMDR
jgi:hypothetical protein